MCFAGKQPWADVHLMSIFFPYMHKIVIIQSAVDKLFLALSSLDTAECSVPKQRQAQGKAD